MSFRRAKFLSALVVCMLFGILASAQSAETMKLRKWAESQKIFLGTAVMPDYLNDSLFVDNLTNNFNYITVENHMKWETIHPSQDNYDYSSADKIVEFAVKNGLKVRGHALTWHYQNPGWLGSGVLKTNARAILKDHIMNVVGHYKGKIRDWDVVNEPLSENGELRQNIWFLTLGAEYIELAFKWAREADPKAKLFINEYGNEWLSSKSDGFYQLVKELKSKGVPIDGVGLQFHLDGHYMPDFGAIAQNFKRLSDLGVEIQITELDVRLQNNPSEKAIDQQAKIYGEIMRLALAYKACTAMITWGISDKHSWIPSSFNGYGHGLLFDESYKSKPAAKLVAEILSSSRPKPEYFDKYKSTVNSRAVPPFRAVKLQKEPVIDGKVDGDEWKNGYTYSLLFNQLDIQNLAPTSTQKDIYATWKICFSGTKAYGLLTREDDITVTGHKNPWENDNFELFYSVGNNWKQIRTIVGQGWQTDINVNGKAIWSPDGKVLEFVVDLGIDLTGKTLGWSAALSDNDTPKNEMRKYQLYPIVGNNTGWQGKGFGEISFQNEDGYFIDGPAVGAVMPFASTAITKAPVLDGDPSDTEWKNASLYPFGFNQYSMDQTVPLTGTYAGHFKILNDTKTIYGLVQLTDSDIQKYKSVEIALSIFGNTVLLNSETGKDFTKTSWKKPLKAVWSKDMRTLEFMVEISDKPLANNTAKFSIGLLGAADSSGTPVFGLFPFCGYNRINSGTGKDLGAIMSKKEIDLADLLCQ